MYYSFQASRTGIVVSLFFGAKSDLGAHSVGLGSHSFQQKRALQHISRSRCAAELAKCRCFGQMVFSGDILLRWGGQITSICLDTVWTDTCRTCRFNTTGQVCKDAESGEGAAHQHRQRTLSLITREVNIRFLLPVGLRSEMLKRRLKITFKSGFITEIILHRRERIM